MTILSLKDYLAFKWPINQSTGVLPDDRKYFSGTTAKLLDTKNWVTPLHPCDKSMLAIIEWWDREKIEQLWKSIERLINNLTWQNWLKAKNTAESNNKEAWKWSWKATNQLHTWLSKLKKWEETYEAYLERIMLIDWNKIIDIERNDTHNKGKEKTITELKKLEPQYLFQALTKIWTIIPNLTQNKQENLTWLQGFYKDILDEKVKIFERSIEKYNKNS